MLRRLGRALYVVALGVLGAWVLRTWLYEPAIVESSSMEPTLLTGVHYVVNRWTYHLRRPARGDLISFISPLDHETRLMKRVIAIPGDVIELRHKQVVLNGRPQDEPYVQYQRAREALEGDSLGPLKVPEDMYFVLGDNRDVSEDSSVWIDPGTHQRIYFLPRANIKGKVIKL